MSGIQWDINRIQWDMFMDFNGIFMGIGINRMSGIYSRINLGQFDHDLTGMMGYKGNPVKMAEVFR